jgi:hypothetical protein
MSRINLITVLTVMFLTSTGALAGDLPDPALTPGAVLTTDAVLVCQLGYANRFGTSRAKSRLRPIWSTDHLSLLRRVRGGPADHPISLELGGSNDIQNLWPESYQTEPWSAHRKDCLEDRLHELVCSAQISLEQAQHEIATDWIAAYRRYIGDP